MSKTIFTIIILLCFHSMNAQNELYVPVDNGEVEFPIGVDGFWAEVYTEFLMALEEDNIETLKTKKEIIKYYEGFFDAQTGKTFVIDNISNYIIEPFDTISVNSIEYRVYEVGKDFKRDEYTLKVWKV